MDPKKYFRDPADAGSHEWQAYQLENGRYIEGVALVGDGGIVSPSTPLPIGSSSQRDAFSRLRVSQPVELFSAASLLDSAPRFYESVLSGSGTAVHNPSTASVDMSVTASASDKVVRQSSHYVPYRPGKSQQVFVTGNLCGQEAGVTKRIGLFDDSITGTGDGLFFELTATDFAVVRRSSTSGVSTDARTVQADWSNGLPDGVTLDFTKQQVFVIDFGWLGSAVIRFGMVLEGQIHILHEEYPSNTIDAPFMSRPSLPVRWEISSDGSGAGSMCATCASVQSEGGFNPLGIRRSALTTAPKTTTSTALVPVISIRLKSAYNRGILAPESFEVFTNGSSPSDYALVVLLNPTLTGATFAGSASAAVEYDTNATAVSGGEILASGFGVGGGGPIKSVSTPGYLASDEPLASDYSGVSDILTLAVRPQGTSSTNFYGKLSWREFY